MIPEKELEFRRRWYKAHAHRATEDEGRLDFGKAERERFETSVGEGLANFAHLGASGDVEAFKSETQAWAVKPETIGFNGFNGQMFINQLVSAEGDPAALARLLSDGARLPADDDDARHKLSALVDYTNEVRTGPHPSPGRVPFVLPYLWALQDAAKWPVMWASSVRYLETFNGVNLPSEPVDRYFEFRDRATELDPDGWAFWQVTRWWDEAQPVFLDPVLCDRCTMGEKTHDELNAVALVGFSRYLSTQLSEPISDALGRSVIAKKPNLMWTKERFRGDTYADWAIDDQTGLGLRVWLNARGAAVGVRVGNGGSDWYAEALRVIEAHPVDGYETFASGRSRIGRDVGFTGGRSGEYVYAKFYDKDQLGDLDVPAIVRRAADLQPLLDHLDAAAKGGDIEDFDIKDDPLAELVEEFLQATGYPEQADEGHRSDREHFARLLQPEVLPTLDVSDLRRIYNSGRYGSAGAQQNLNITVRDASAAEYDELLDTLVYLLWGDGEDVDRIDTVLDGERKIRGLGESGLMKLMAIAHPDRYVPTFAYGGPMGKRVMLRLLDLPEPSGSRAELHVHSSRAIHERLNRFFPGDPWGMTQFCYWLSQRDEEPEIDTLDSRLDDLAENELTDRAFLAQLVKLLEDKGQIILYGPPGTGKTYLARKLAEALAPNPARRKLVQFHPSTSYEDFFEGFRPEQGVEGDIAYRLTPGPLALLAEDARKSPGARHVMVIDEINRANLPKVFGELLFLLEYRGEAVTTLYRPDDPFELPKELLFIGTMNTADRSIALVDAALRRRFHFVPFFPHDGPMAGLLDRWLEKNKEPAWVGEMVETVNAELVKKLGGPHLQIGPSYFMKKGLDEAAVRLIWEYNIEPFIEDQLYGDPQQIGYFKFDNVVARFKRQSGLDELDPSDPTAEALPVVEPAADEAGRD